MRKILIFLLYVMLIVLMLTIPAMAADITVKWDANSEDDLAGYNLYYKVDIPNPPYDGTGAVEGNSPVNISLIDLIDPNNPEFTLTGLDAAHIYFLVLTAYDDVGNESGYSNEVQTFYISNPQNGFSVNSNDYTAFLVSGRGAAGYDVEIYSDSTLVGNTTANADGSWELFADFTGVTEGVISLSAQTTVINMVVSNIVNGELDITAPAPPAIPQNLNVVSTFQTQIDIAWSAVTDANEYIIYRDGIDIVSTADINYSDVGLLSSTTYEYEVASYNEYGISDRSDLISATTLSNNTSPSNSSDDSGCFISTIGK